MIAALWVPASARNRIYGPRWVMGAGMSSMSYRLKAKDTTAAKSNIRKAVEIATSLATASPEREDASKSKLHGDARKRKPDKITVWWEMGDCQCLAHANVLDSRAA
jgi:hypothetical protein